MKIIDITIPLSEQTPVWEGDKGISINLVERIGLRSDFNVSRIELGVHSGTHIDSPFHVIEGGNTVDQIPLNILIGDVQVVQIPSEYAEINSKCLQEINIDYSIDRVLFKTTNSDYWENDPYSFNREYVALNSQGAQFLAERNFQLIGVDYFSISTFNNLVEPHVILLKNNVVLLENIDLRNVVPGIYKLICLPIKLNETEGAPVRAVLISE
jgi:arylformamidase